MPIMDVHLSEVRTIAITGVKPRWQIRHQKDVMMVDGAPYIRMSKQSYGFNLIVASCNELAARQCEGRRGCLLTYSKGMAHLIELRNKQQAAGLVEPEQCTLFAEPQLKKARTLSRRVIESKRKAPGAMTLEVDADGIKHEITVLRPVHPTDCLFVPYESSMIASVLHVIAVYGFETDEEMPEILPKGIFRRQCGEVFKYIVKFKKPDGSCGYRTYKDMESAMAYQAGVACDHGEVDHEDIGDEEEYGDDEVGDANDTVDN